MSQILSSRARFYGWSTSNFDTVPQACKFSPSMRPFKHLLGLPLQYVSSTYMQTLRVFLTDLQMLLDQETAKLGYPGEISRSLNADHHGVCKFVSVEDSNYKVVLSALKSLVSTYAPTGKHRPEIALSLGHESNLTLPLFLCCRPNSER